MVFCIKTIFEISLIIYVNGVEIIFIENINAYTVEFDSMSKI